MRSCDFLLIIRYKKIGVNVLTLLQQSFFTYVMITHSKFIKCFLGARNSKPITKIGEECRANASLMKPKRLFSSQRKPLHFLYKRKYLSIQHMLRFIWFITFNVNSNCCSSASCSTESENEARPISEDYTNTLAQKKI